MADAAATTCAKSELWLATNPLNRWSVLDYFAITHFYQPEGCLNEAALAEGKHRSETSHLQCGPDQFEYAVSEALDPALYVILKRHRSAAGAVRRLGVFYVLDGAVYQAPSLHAVAASRLQRCAFDMRGALDALRSRLAFAAEEPAAQPQQQPQPVDLAAREEERRMEHFILRSLKEYDAGRLTEVEAPRAAHQQQPPRAEAAPEAMSLG